MPTKYSGPIGDFSADSVPKSHRKDAFDRFSSSFKWTHAFNQLESIASAFTSGVADEQTAFPVIGRIYCLDIEWNYDLISASRIRNEPVNPYWSNIIELYLLWRPRLTKKQLETLKNQTEERISNLPDKFLSPYGVDD